MKEKMERVIRGRHQTRAIIQNQEAARQTKMLTAFEQKSRKAHVSVRTGNVHHTTPNEAAGPGRGLPRAGSSLPARHTVAAITRTAGTPTQASFISTPVLRQFSHPTHPTKAVGTYG